MAHDDRYSRFEYRRLIASDERLKRGWPMLEEEDEMSKEIFPQATRELAATRKKLAPEIHDAFTAFSERVFAEGALPVKTKQLIAVAAAHITQCPYCIRSHTKAALRHGATEEEIMEAIWVAAEMRAGGAYAHAALALDTIAEVKERQGD